MTFGGVLGMVNLMTMNMNNEMWQDCNDMIGRILTYLDEAKVGTGIKKAVKSEIWDFHNKHNGDDNDYRNDKTEPLGI